MAASLSFTFLQLGRKYYFEFKQQNKRIKVSLQKSKSIPARINLLLQSSSDQIRQKGGLTWIKQEVDWKSFDLASDQLRSINTLSGWTVPWCATFFCFAVSSLVHPTSSLNSRRFLPTRSQSLKWSARHLKQLTGFDAGLYCWFVFSKLFL